MASMNEPGSTTTSSTTHQSQAEASTTSSMPDITQLSLEHNPDIFTIICCNDTFQLALDHNTIKILLRVCKRARPVLSSKVVRFHKWCQNAGLCHPDGRLRIGFTPGDQIALSLHCANPGSADRSWLEDQAYQGNASASYFLARILQVDLDREAVDDDEPEENNKRQQLIQYLNDAAHTNHAMAQLHLAGCYLNGLGVDQDQAKAVELYRSLAKRGIPQAHIALGRCYESGEGVEQDYDTAIEWYSKAPDKGSEDGRLHIVFLRGWLSFIGHGVEQSDVAALGHWQEVSTKSTDPIIKPIATHMVGWMHYLGRGTVQDKQNGVKIIRENKSDVFKLGEDECLAYWSSTSSDSPVACKFFNLCQMGSDRDWLCRHLMAVCLFHGFRTTKDEEKAAGIFEQLANEGHSDSQFWMGVCYSCEVGVWMDYKAFEWYNKSADQDNSYGQWTVGWCYDNGHGVAQDHLKVVEWYRKSAEQGNRYAQNYLGECHQYGDGVPENIDTAITWFRKSAEQGHQSAIDRLKKLGQWP